MAGINKVILIGNLGRDPELRYTQGGTAVATLNLATTRAYTNRNNERVEETEWHRVTVWGKDAENANKYLTKGRQVYVEGRLRTHSYDDKDGVKRYSTEIVAETVQYLGSGRGGAGGGEPEGGGGGGGYGGGGGRGGGGRGEHGGGGGRGGGRGGDQGGGRGAPDQGPSEGGYDNYIPDPADDDIPF
jgi:single-strand DNA-binding protein